MGLNKAGKTSILLNLAGKNLLSYTSPDPTAGKKHIAVILDTETQLDKLKSIYWEAGGQEVYRTEYLEDPEKFLVGYERIIFVIDIQDEQRYDEALTYLTEILQKLSELNITSKINVYLHKSDPEIDKSDKYSEENINQNLTFKIKVINPQFKLRIFKTSLFTVFRKSLVD